MFNAIKQMDYLVDCEFSPAQAKGSVNSTVEIMNEKFVTKEQFNEFILAYKDDMENNCS